MKLTGAKILLESLKKAGVSTIFGYPGGAVLPIYDALYDERKLKHILTAHEQGATHAADGYARVTGKVGVVLVTSGPGATNTVTGIATAFRDSVPMVVITGQVPQNQIGTAAFQEIDTVSITTSITKKSFLIKSVEEIPQVVKEAFKIANEGRKGPVVIDIPKDLQMAKVDHQIEDCEMEVCAVVDKDGGNSFLKDKLRKNINKAVELIKDSKRTIIYAGGGVISSGAEEELLQFSEKIKSPVTCTLMALGGFPGNHKYFTGLSGMHGTRCSNYAITNCDLLIAIGARFSDRVTSKVAGFAPGAKIIHIDIDESEIGKIVKVDVPLEGDVKEVLKLITAAVEEKNEGEWSRQIQEWKDNYPLSYSINDALSGEYVVEKISELTKGECIICTEVGQNQIWAAQYFKYTNPRSFISSGGLGTMGFGLGAAIGAYYGDTEKKVINIAGDGSFKMNSNELATISRYRVPIVQVVLNNSCLGMVRQWQELFYQGRFSHTLFNSEVDFIKLGEAYGIKSVRITKNEEVEEVIKYALELNEPIIIECVINSNENVFPIVPPGEMINNMLTE